MYTICAILVKSFVSRQLMVARELVSHLRLKCLANSVAQPPQERREAGAVARELASHLRLKHMPDIPDLDAWPCGEGTGFSSEIETHTISHTALQSLARR